MKILENYTYTVSPGMCFDKICKALDAENIEYEILSMDQAPDGTPEHCIFKGREIDHHIGCLKTRVDSDELRKFVDALY